jgi:hypothetical protein
MAEVKAISTQPSRVSYGHSFLRKKPLFLKILRQKIGAEMALLIGKCWNSDTREQLSLEEFVDELKESAVWDFMNGVDIEIVNRYLDKIGKWEAANYPR